VASTGAPSDRAELATAARGNEAVHAEKRARSQTDQTDRQNGVEAIAKSQKDDSDLSARTRQTDGAQDDFPKLPQSLRRAPVASANPQCAYCQRGPTVTNPLQLRDWNGCEVSLHLACQARWERAR